MNLALFLQQMDLTEYERSVIETLSASHALDATSIVKVSGVPQGRVYDVINSLVEKGIVSVVPGRPKRFQIEDIKKSLKDYLESQRENLAEKVSGLKELTLPAKSFSLKKPNSVQIYSGREEHLWAIRSMYEKARKEIMQIAPLFVGSFQTRLARSRATKKGVSVKVIVRSVSESNRISIEQAIADGCEIKVLDRKDLLSIVISDDELIMGVQDHTSNEERLFIHTQNPALVEAMKQVFDNQWKEGVGCR